MDMTEAQTGCIIGLTSSDDPFQFLFPTHSNGESLRSVEVTSGQKFSEARGSSNCTGMETSLKPSLKTKVQRHEVKFDTEDDCREKTVRFSVDDACMDVTRSHTVHITTDFESQSHQILGLLPACGEKTMRFTANDAAMDMTQCLTVNIASKFISDSVLPVKKQQGETCGLPRNRASSAHSLDPGFHTSILKPSGPSVNPVITRMTPSATQPFNMEDSSNGGTICPENDVSMDMTEAQTGRILGITTIDDPLRCLTQDTNPQSGHMKKAEKTPRQQHSDAKGACNHEGMETSLTASLKTKVQRRSVKFDADDNYREKTVRFTANDAGMDVTRSHTVNIATDFEPQSHQNLDFLPACGEKTVRFTATDAAMDVTRSHTVNIATGFEPQSHQNLDFLPACGEKTVRFTATDAAMDVTRSHTVKIATGFEPQSHQNLDRLSTCGEKTMRFTANEAAMDVTRSHTVNIATDFEPQSHQNLVLLPTSGEKTMEFTASTAAMDMTQCPTVNIVSNSVSGSVLPHQDSNILSTHENMDFPFSVKKRESGTRRTRINRSSSAHILDSGLKNTLFRTSGTWSNPVVTKAVAPATASPQETVDTNGLLDQLKMQKPDVDIENEGQDFVSAAMEKAVNKTLTGCPEDDVSMDMTEAQTGRILGQRCTEEPPQCVSAAQDMYPSCDHLKKTKVASQPSSETLGSSNVEGVQITGHPDSLDSNETEARNEPKPTNQTCSLSQMGSPPAAVDHDVDAAPSQNSRQMRLADLHSKVRRLSHMINTAPDTIALDSCTAPLPQLEHAMDKNSKDKTESPPVMESEPETGLVNTEENAQPENLMQGEQPSTATTPFNLKTKQLMSRLSVGGFKPKLPQRRKSDDPKKATSVGECTRTITVNVTTQLKNFDGDVSDIYDEELGSCEDMSEMLDTRSLQKVTEKVSCPQECDMHESEEDGALEQDSVSACHGKKRPLPVDENIMEDEKRMKASSEMATDFEMGLQPHIEECDGNSTTAPGMTTQTTDYFNNSHTASSRCEATFESTFKQSMFESQLEDYASDVQRKLDDGTITVLEFLKVFNIDFVIHNPRQSVLPGRLLSDTDRTPMDLLKDRHINRPKQTVYETDVLNLTEKVEGLKERMQDLDRPLKTVNRPLWEEMTNSSEKELKSFGAKLKERNNLFRKMAKVQSHEMKEVLYSNLVLANREEQQMLKGKIEEADEMIKSLDDCIRELETELAAVEEKGFEDTPSLKSRQEEMQRVTDALVDNERQISELEMQKKQNSNKVKRLQTETRNLESHVTMLHTVNEWKFGGKSDNCTVYTFLHETFHLQLVYENPNGNDADNQSERKISHITFTLQLDDEKSQGHACLVHKLLSQYVEGEAALVERYPTSRHVPQLLHDVGLVVSRCRLLGEELRLLKMWGGLRLDILNISCVDTRVHIVFSSLKKVSKFEVVFSVSLTNHVCVLQVHSFRNMIGSTTIQQIEEIVASFSPSKNLLTKIVNKIHESVL
ncbi:outer kinetochore KNL1 complex subunit KNL1-like [Pempheris klunzingeri]|uniref:outer kinetochore KNL1 complex subunit KNL1-like n=1 Tax=Pempheris klunzingeri TaxID=3127111 RepID=UPI0039817A7A